MTPSSRRWVGLVFISIAVSLIIVDSTIVNVAVPSIVDELGITSTEVQWVQESYTLVFASLLLVFGSLADRLGRRAIMLTGVVIFAAASVAAALAPDGGLLILSRLIQGVGGAMILPTTLSLINATFRGRERGIAFAVWGSTIGGMAALGPLLGGWLTTAFSWRWAFGINIPLGLIILIGVWLTVAESRGERTQRIDVVGAVLSVVTMASLVFGLIEGRTYGWWLTETRAQIGGWEWPWDLSPVPVAFLVALVGLVAFILWGLRRERAGKSTLLAFRLFTIASFRNGNIAAMVVSLGEFGIILALPLWLQFVLGLDALQTGLVLLALAGGSFVASGIAGALANRVAPVWIVRVGLLAEVVGVAGVAFMIGPDSSPLALLPFLFVYGLGVGLATAQLTGVVLADVPVAESGQASGTQSTSRQLGAALGVAVLGTVLFSSTAGILDTKLADRGVPGDQREQTVSAVVDSAGGAIAGLEASPQTQDIADDAKAAFSEGTRAAAFTAAGFLALGLLSTLSLGSAASTPRAGRPAEVADGAAAAPPPA
ncbi:MULTISPECIES: DHA2 family efflux MFS transporter permease subunit [Microbacterium]|uniref:DHA2 family efflux MFS transporter permease subunit n=1 Tax=Microbacterium wangchenii TaxID=2541726 RepID=A0ABX5SVC6_9MICO|nr:MULTISPECIES: DHA2 family efflux MFS transporter permease subunit [Microbacterium]MCK6065827.1 DHA2 family efflux MFS transporter permease subunit [Microbacterium sp. EYE_512]QBR90135.1 DHA2 family efflux MFS transporter permease subunit [Microbacterium wangchenii]TFV85055.1 DHA2 family efflux MFS transporter permease subunit [Microbacterium sp. dk485]TXK11849.1 DHA2 family efflux MFS transporter permease subunit [Microbacterium wangchenii]